MLKGKIIKGNPYDFNFIAVTKKEEARKEEKVELTPSVARLAMDQDFMAVANTLGVFSKADLNEYYQKITDICRWAVDRAGSRDLKDVIDTIKERMNACPQVAERRLLDLWISTEIEARKKKGEHNGYYDKKEYI